jgi:hypothetical protein
LVQFRDLFGFKNGHKYLYIRKPKTNAMLHLRKCCTLLVLGLITISTTSWMGVMRFSNRSHQMTIAGTSNLHDWTTNVQEISLIAEMELVNGYVSTVGTVTMSAKVNSIKSDKGSVMDGKTREALKGDKNPNITYRLRQVEIAQLKDKISKLSTEGTLNIAGVTKPVKMDVFARQLPNGEVEVWGAHALSMKDYGMQAPTALMGTIKTGDLVTINYSVILKK